MQGTREQHRGADLELRITSEDVVGGHQLHFVLHSAAGTVGHTHDQIDGTTKLVDNPRAYQKRLFRVIEGLERGRLLNSADLPPEDVDAELGKLGQELYRELFPTALKSAYWEFRDRVRTLLIVSDESWIPWEVVKPYREGDDDDFLCCRFELTRWLTGKTAPAADLGADRIVVFEAGQTPGELQLPQAASESRLLMDLAERHPDVEGRVLSGVSFSSLEETLRLGGYGLLHFIGHGAFDERDPNASRFRLADGRYFRPRDLHAAIEARIRQDRPLVFFNVCHAAQQDHGLASLGGWASRWVLDCGCGAFIAPAWAVGDKSAAVFAQTFYQALGRGDTLGRAAREARLESRTRHPGSTSWLAYTVYAHPEAWLRLDLGPTPVRLASAQWRSDRSPPGSLLRAEYGIVPFHGRDDEIEDLLSWSAADSPIGIRLYTGAGGMGKTRLALEVAQRLCEKDWQAGFLVPDPSRSPDAIWRDLAVRDRPSLIVVDYAETRRDLLVPLLRQAGRIERGRFRFLLLARAALDWWERLKSEGDGVGDLLSGPATRWHALRPLATTPEERQHSYRAAMAAFAERLQRPRQEPNPDELASELYERVLLLHMKALADLEEAATQDEDGVLDYVLRRERRFWRRLAEERCLAGSVADGIGRAMGLITLGGGARNEDHAVRILASLKCFQGQDPSTLLEVAGLLHNSYPGERWIEPMRPDRFGEHLVQRELEKGSDELLNLALGGGTDG